MHHAHGPASPHGAHAVATSIFEQREARCFFLCAASSGLSRLPAGVEQCKPLDSMRRKSHHFEGHSPAHRVPRQRECFCRRIAQDGPGHVGE